MRVGCGEGVTAEFVVDYRISHVLYLKTIKKSFEVKHFIPLKNSLFQQDNP
jgi:hypothetical protein